jgi:hypothetical protein
MQEKDETNYFNLFILGGIIVLAINIYWFTGTFLASVGARVSFIDTALLNLQKNSGIFKHPLQTLIPAILFQVIYIIGTRPKQNTLATLRRGLILALTGAAIYFLSFIFLTITSGIAVNAVLYILAVIIGFYFLTHGLMEFWKSLSGSLMRDRFNDENETFMQETRLLENEYSINIPTSFEHKRRQQKGWINVINPFRGSMVLGNPGSGKSYAIIEEFMRQSAIKEYTSCIYDFKFPDQTAIHYNNYIQYLKKKNRNCKFYVVNFDDPQYSHRCNPISPELLTSQSDAVNAAKTLLLNLNKSWITKKGDFFVESPIALVSALIWYLRIAKNGKYCSLPHLIMFLSKSDDIIFKILSKYNELRPLMTPFVDALEKGAMEQLAGQTASARIPLAQIITKELFWVFSGDDFTLDINNPESPKIICVGNNPKREAAYSAPLGLFFTQLIKEINQKDRLHSFLCMDEFPSLYTQGVDQLIATARSNKVAVMLGMQDFTQITRDYGKEVADVIINICGNIFCGQVVRDTAKAVQDMLGKILQQRESLNLNRGDTTKTINTQMEFIVPESKIANFSQGQFAVKVADNFDQQLKLKISNATVVIDNNDRKHYDRYKLPIITEFPKDENGNSLMGAILDENFNRIQMDIDMLVLEELAEIEVPA